MEYDDDDLEAARTHLEYYDMNNNFNNETLPFSSFPNDEQMSKDSFLRKNLLLAAVSSSLYVMDEWESILALLPSRSRFYSIEFLSIIGFGSRDNLYLLIPNSSQCPIGTYKNDFGIWPCSRCQVHKDFNNSVTATCPQCTDKTYCPLEFIEDINFLPDVEQHSGYPETPDIDVFEDILMSNMFRTECFTASPFLLSTIVLVFSIVICLMKLSKRFASKQYRFILDLIGQEKLWFGGIISISFFVRFGFAVRFSYFHHPRYPTEEQQLDSRYSCQLNHLFNAKFQTSLQFLNSPSDQHEQIFNFLNSQEFTMNVELINTTLHCGTSSFILYTSAKLPVHSLNFLILFQGNQSVDAIRIGLTGTHTRQMHNYVQKLNFSEVFNQTNKVVTRSPRISLQSTKVINITKGLTHSDSTMYSGLWLPTFTYDMDQLFTEVDLASDRLLTTLALVIHAKKNKTVVS